MLPLQNGNKCSEISVTPKNWKSLTRITGDWCIHYRFYSGDKFKQVRIRGMNEFKNIQDRKDATKQLIENEKDMLLNRGYNPILKRFFSDETGEITKDSPLIKCLEYALQKTVCNHNTRLDIESVLRYFSKSAVQLSYGQLPIGEVRRKHIRLILDNLSSLKENFSDNNFNHYRKYLSKLFNELVALDVIDYNPVKEIAKRKTVRRIRTTIYAKDRTAIDLHLRSKGLTSFRLYMRIFFHSGCRSTELLNLKAKDVNIIGSYFICTIQKGKHIREVKKTIKDISLRYWKLAIKGAKPEDYIFSEGLIPGSNRINSHQITRRWKYHVLNDKDLNIKAGFYALKHSHTTEVVTLTDNQTAATINGHTSTGMVINIYDTLNKSREHEKIKQLKNTF